MGRHTAYDEPSLGAPERALARRRRVAAVVTVVALAGVAGGSAVGAVAGAHDDRADQTSASSMPHTTM